MAESVTWYWDEMLNKDHITSRLLFGASHVEDKDGNKIHGQKKIELLRGFLDRDITFSASNNWGVIADASSEVLGEKFNKRLGSNINFTADGLNAFRQNAQSTFMLGRKFFNNLLGRDGEQDYGVNAQAFNKSVVNYSDWAKIYSGTEVNFPNSFTCLMLADESGKDPRLPLLNVLGDLIGRLQLNNDDLIAAMEKSKAKFRSMTNQEQAGKVAGEALAENDQVSDVGISVSEDALNKKVTNKASEVRSELLKAANSSSSGISSIDITLDDGNVDTVFYLKAGEKTYRIRKSEAAKLTPDEIKKKLESSTVTVIGELEPLYKNNAKMTLLGESAKNSQTTDENTSAALQQAENQSSGIINTADEIFETLMSGLTNGDWGFQLPPGGYVWDPKKAKSESEQQGTLTLYSGNHFRVANLLVDTLDVDMSQFVTVEGFPLWVRITMTFTTASRFSATDVSRALRMGRLSSAEFDAESDRFTKDNQDDMVLGISRGTGIADSKNRYSKSPKSTVDNLEIANERRNQQIAAEYDTKVITNTALDLYNRYDAAIGSKYVVYWKEIFNKSTDTPAGP